MLSNFVPKLDGSKSLAHFTSLNCENSDSAVVSVFVRPPSVRNFAT